MPRMQVYLPDDLYAEVKARKLPASELLQEAIRAEIRRDEKQQAMADFVAATIREYGEPSTADIARAEELVARIKSHLEPPVTDAVEDSVAARRRTPKAG